LLKKNVKPKVAPGATLKESLLWNKNCSQLTVPTASFLDLWELLTHTWFLKNKMSNGKVSPKLVSTLARRPLTLVSVLPEKLVVTRKDLKSLKSLLMVLLTWSEKSLVDLVRKI